jgi:hypothetical protein
LANDLACKQIVCRVAIKLGNEGLEAVTYRLTDGGLDPAIRIRALEALNALSGELDRSAAEHSTGAADDLRQAADGAMRAVVRVLLEIDAA